MLRVYVIWNNTIDFIVLAEQSYTLVWNYYKAGQLLTADIENEWLLNAPEWLIGEAGERISRNLRDQDALASFQDMKQKARAAVFGDILADEDTLGPLIMGGSL